MQFKIPQNVQIADKIIGPLSMKDLAICGFGGGIGYVAYLQLDNQTWPFITIPAVLITIAVIFVKISDMTFSQWTYSLILYISRPQKRVWKNMSNDVFLLDAVLNPVHMKAKKVGINEEALLEKKEETYRNLYELARLVDHGEEKPGFTSGHTEVIDTVHDDDLLRHTIVDHHRNS
jgi:hypothetical protein